VKGSGEQALAGPRLAKDQDGGKSTRPGLAPEQLLDLNPHRHQPRAVTYYCAQHGHGAPHSTPLRTAEENFRHQWLQAVHERQAIDFLSFCAGIALAVERRQRFREITLGQAESQELALQPWREDCWRMNNPFGRNLPASLVSPLLMMAWWPSTQCSPRLAALPRLARRCRSSSRKIAGRPIPRSSSWRAALVAAITAFQRDPDQAAVVLEIDRRGTRLVQSHRVR